MKKNLSFLFVLVFFGCSPYAEEKVTITKEYIINPNWDKQSNSLDVNEMRLKKGLEKINPSSATSFKLLHNLVEVEKSSFGGNVTYNGEDYSQRKVYFERNNGFLWWGDFHNSKSTKKVLGALKKETWYL